MRPPVVNFYRRFRLRCAVRPRRVLPSVRPRFPSGAFSFPAARPAADNNMRMSDMSVCPVASRHSLFTVAKAIEQLEKLLSGKVSPPNSYEHNSIARPWHDVGGTGSFLARSPSRTVVRGRDDSKPLFRSRPRSVARRRFDAGTGGCPRSNHVLNEFSRFYRDSCPGAAGVRNDSGVAAAAHDRISRVRAPNERA